MFLKASIQKVLIDLHKRFFQANLYTNQTGNFLQYHSGGDDYSPASDCEGLGGTIGNNPANGFIFAWKDNILKKSQPGEKRIYSVKNGTEVAAEIYLKNDGNIEITGSENVEVNINGSITALHVNASDGVTGTFTNSITVKNGIVIGGS